MMISVIFHRQDQVKSSHCEVGYQDLELECINISARSPGQGPREVAFHYENDFVLTEATFLWQSQKKQNG